MTLSAVRTPPVREALMTTIAVTGASGKLGRATIGYLLERKVAPDSIVAVVRDAQKVADLAARKVQVRRGDYTDAASLATAFRGIDTLLFVSTNVFGEERMLQHRNVIGAARAAGVGHIIYTSVIKPAAVAHFAGSPSHFQTEALIRESGITHTFFRNNLYLDIVPFMFGEALQTGVLEHNSGRGRIGFISRDDIAGGLAAVLSAGERGNREYPITAIAPYGLDEVASALGSAVGRSVTYRELSSDEFRKSLAAKGLPAPAVEMTVALGEAIRAGEFDEGSPQLERLLGRTPVTLEAFLLKALAPK
jgi:NAD(P)H dehydrogenase (quinone)